MEPDPVLVKCDELLELLYANRGHVKLRRLTEDIEDLRDRMLRQGAARDQLADRDRADR